MVAALDDILHQLDFMNIHKVIGPHPRSKGNDFESEAIQTEY